MSSKIDFMSESGLITAKDVLRLGPFKHLLNHQPPQRIYFCLSNAILKYEATINSVKIKILGGEIVYNKQKSIFYVSMMGAPAVLFLLEILCEWGVKEFVGIGLAGLISEKDLAIGDVAIVSSAFSDEGSSHHYGKQNDQLVSAASELNQELGKSFGDHDLSFKFATCASTDAFFRETNSKIAFYRRTGCDLIDMETSAILQFGSFMKVQTSMVLLVTDSLSNQRWQPAFDSSAVQKSKKSLSKWLFTTLSDNYS